jgi:hypothetical protein
MAAGHALPELYPLRAFFHAFFARIGRSWRRKAFLGEVLKMFARSIHRSPHSWLIIELNWILLRIQLDRLSHVDVSNTAVEMPSPELCYR